MDLSIIIVNWKSAALCEACLESIYASPMRVAYEVIVVDNASFDGCDRMLAARFPLVKFVQSETNVGFAGANNLAFSRSTGSTVCFLNPDTVVLGAALQTLYDAVNAHATTGAVGALLRNADRSVQTSCVLPFPTILNQAFDIEWVRQRLPTARLFGAAAIFSDVKEPAEVEAVSGACIMMRSATFQEVGMFSPEYFMYAEDIDLCHKVRSTGRKVYLINSAEIVHLGGGSSKEPKSRLLGAVLMRESTFVLLRKFRGPGYALAYRLVLGAMGLVRVAGLLVWLPLASAAGRGRSIVEILQRWWHLVAWVAGIVRVPQPLNAEAAAP